VIGQIQAWLDHLNAYSEITERSLRRLRDAPAVEAFASTLLVGERARLGGHEFWIANLRELDGHEFPTVMAVQTDSVLAKAARICWASIHAARYQKSSSQFADRAAPLRN
jgi:hypothetical protein